LYNYLFAKRHGGDFLLRIEDTDSSREVSGAVDYVTQAFDWLGIMPNEGYGIGGDCGPYIQSERKDIYKEYANKLVESGHAYYAFDTKEDLAKMREDFESSGVKNTGYAGVVRERMKNSLYMPSDVVEAKIAAGEPHVIRFKMPRAEDVKFHDEVRGWVVFNTKALDDKVIWKSSDGLPTYHLANVVDDKLMNISHVIRGEEWLSSTPLHVLLYKAFGWELPIYAHLPLLLGEDGKKLSKRHGDTYGYPIFPLTWDYTTHENKEAHVTGFKHEGYEPDALLNFLVLLGWNPKNNVEFMSLEEMADLFSLENVNKAGAMFDKKKLLNFNAHYLRSRDADTILVNMTNMPEDFIFKMSGDKLDLIASMATERAVFAHELGSSLGYLYESPVISDDFKMKNVDEFVRVMNVFVAEDFMDDFEEKEWTSGNIRYELEHISANMSIKVGKIMPMLRTALCGGASGPQLPDVMYVIGREETKLRIDSLLDKIKELA
jgi:glutamyl-tRNA synthetase